MPVRVSKRFDKRTMEGEQSSDGKYRGFLGEFENFSSKTEKFQW